MEGWMQQLYEPDDVDRITYFKELLPNAANLRIVFPKMAESIYQANRGRIRIASVLPSSFLPEVSDHEDKEFQSSHLLDLAIGFPNEYQFLTGYPGWRENTWSSLEKGASQMSGAEKNFPELLATINLLFPDQLKGNEQLDFNWSRFLPNVYQIGNLSWFNHLKYLKLAYPETAYGIDQSRVLEEIKKQVASWDFDTLPSEQLLYRAAAFKILLSTGIKMTDQGLSLQSISLPDFDKVTPELPERRRF